MSQCDISTPNHERGASGDDGYSPAEWDAFLSRLQRDEEDALDAALSNSPPPQINAAPGVHADPTTASLADVRIGNGKDKATNPSSSTEDVSSNDRLTASQQPASRPSPPPSLFQPTQPLGAPMTRKASNTSYGPMYASWAGPSSDASTVNHTHDVIGYMPQPLVLPQQTPYAPIVSLMPGTIGTPLQPGLGVEASTGYTPIVPSCISDRGNATTSGTFFNGSQSDAPPAMRGASAGGSLATMPSAGVSLLSPKSISMGSTPNASLSHNASPHHPTATATPMATVPSADDPAVQSNLFICGLASDVDDATLEQLFEPYGTIESAKVMLDIHTGRSRCIAFVKYTTVEAAQSATQALNGVVVHGQCLKVRVANSRAAYLPGNPTNKTFLRNVPLTVTRAELMAYFSQFGEVTDISIHADSAGMDAHSSTGNIPGAALSTTSLTMDGEHSVTSNPSLLTPDDGTPRLNIVFITFTTKEAAATAAAETHTKMPFKDCNGVPLLAKVAEDSSRRVQRLARRTQSTTGAGASTTSASHTSGGAAAGGLRSPNASLTQPALPGTVMLMDGSLYYTPTDANNNSNNNSNIVGGLMGAGASGSAPQSAGVPVNAPPPYAMHQQSNTQPMQQQQQQGRPTMPVPAFQQPYFGQQTPQQTAPQAQSQPPPQQVITVLVPNSQGQHVPLQFLAPSQQQQQQQQQGNTNSVMVFYADSNGMLQQQQQHQQQQPLPQFSRGAPYYMMPGNHSSPTQWM